MSQNVRSRAWAFTVNNWDDNDLGNILELQDTYPSCYIKFGFEEGSKEETPHLQGCVYFKNQVWTNSIKRLIGRCHLKPAFRWSALEEYVEKDGDVYEYGEAPHQGRASKDLIRDTMRDPWSNFHTFQQYRGAYRDACHMDTSIRDTPCTVSFHKKDSLVPLLRAYPGACFKRQYIAQEEVIFDFDDLRQFFYAVKFAVQGIPTQLKESFNTGYIFDPDQIMIILTPEDIKIARRDCVADPEVIEFIESHIDIDKFYA